MDIIIVNWNSGPQLSSCLASLQENREAINSIVVVDNNSSDGSITGISHINPKIHLIQAKHNLGFAAACNLGVAHCKSELILFLNPDTLIPQGVLASATSFLESIEGSQYSTCGIRLIDEVGNTHRGCVKFPTSSMLICRAIGLDRHIGCAIPSYLMKNFDHLSSKDVDHVIGAFYLVRRRVFEMLGGFDERFFVYLEDLDFSLRSRQAGWRIRYIASLSAFHKGGGTSERVRGKRLFYSSRSRILYAFKHFPWRTAMLVTIATLGIEPLARLFRATLRRSVPEAYETIEAWNLLWRSASCFSKIM